MKVLLVLLLVVPSLINAQAPGFAGKHVVVRAHSSFSLVYPFADQHLRQKGTYLNFNTGLDLEYVIGISGSIAIRYGYWPIETVPNGNKTALFPVGVREATYHGHYIGLLYRTYSFNRHGSIAPYGRYFGVDAGYLTGSASEVVETLPPGSTFFESKINTFYAGIQFGKQTIVADYLVLDFGAAMGFVLGFAPEPDEKEGQHIVNAAIRDTGFSHLFRMYFNVGGIFF